MSNELDYMDEIVSEFLVETEELLERLDTDLVALEKHPNDLELINQIFRGAHTIKGTSGFLGFTKISRLTHAAEDILNRLRKSTLIITPEIMDAILATVDRLRSLLDTVAKNHQEGEHEVDDLIARLVALNVSAKTQTQEAGPAVVLDTSAATGNNASAPSAQPDTMIQVHAVPEISVPIEIGNVVSVEVETETNDQNIDKIESPNQPRAAEKSEPTKDPKQQQTVRVPVRRLDHLMNLAGELVLARNRLNQVTSFFDVSLNDTYQTSTVLNESYNLDGNKRLDSLLEKNVDLLAETNSLIGLVTSELQMAIMQTRMLPMETAFRKIPRLVRDLAREVGKEVDLIIEGEDTELDKSVIEVLGDPLTHLIRNAMDHGIETPEKRLAAGKPVKGRLRVFAVQQGNHIVVGIEDDGAGIHADKLKRKAVEKGIISETEANRMNEREAINLVFAPGFSTATVVTNVSGRGVGMDVVKTNVGRLNGMIEVDSRKGVGTTFLLKLPLTLAIIQGLLIEVAEEIFILPIVSILETLRITRKNLYHVARRPVIRLRDSVIPVIDLREFFKIGNETKNRRDDYYVVIAAVSDKKVGLLVDGLRGQEEVVIKSLGDFFDFADAIAGATIMGDGRVRLIIDVAEIIRIEEKKAA